MIRWYRLPGPIWRTRFYNSPKNLTQQGTHESVFCARPAEDVYQVSSWSEMKDYYRPQDSDRGCTPDGFRGRSLIKGNNNFEYDLVDIVRQALAEKGQADDKAVTAGWYRRRSTHSSHWHRGKFLEPDFVAGSNSLGTRPEFRVGKWIEEARALGGTPEEKDSV